MPFIPHSPESLIRRSDSKDPATTCKGITSSGRPCRRAIGTTPQASPTAPSKLRNGVIAMLEQEDEDHDGAAAFFCWQHRDQAVTLAKSGQDGRKANIVTLQSRTSLDTLAERLGLPSERVQILSEKSKKKQPHARPARKETLPKKWQDMDGPLMAVNGRSMKTKKKQNSFLSVLCCFRSVDDDPMPPPRRQRQPEYELTDLPPILVHSQPSDDPMPPPQSRVHSKEAQEPDNRPPKLPSNPVQPQKSHDPIPLSRLPMDLKKAEHPRDEPSKLPSTPVQSPASCTSERTTDSSRPFVGAHQPSQTESLLSHIPQWLSPETTALLLAELAKPISPHDEPGYIYMFWLTKDAINSQVADSLLDTSMIPDGHRKSRLMQSQAARPAGANPTSVLLKIGRTSNVQRRLNEWHRQCGYHLTLLRFYPYGSSLTAGLRPSSPTVSPAAPSKVPNAHKIERLIHLELADKRVKRLCETCGKEHREWFEVRGDRKGLKKVDDVIRRWTKYGQQVGNGTVVA